MAHDFPVNPLNGESGFDEWRRDQARDGRMPSRKTSSLSPLGWHNKGASKSERQLHHNRGRAHMTTGISCHGNLCVCVCVCVCVCPCV